MALVSRMILSSIKDNPAPNLRRRPKTNFRSVIIRASQSAQKILDGCCYIRQVNPITEASIDKVMINTFCAVSNSFINTPRFRIDKKPMFHKTIHYCTH